MAIIDWIALVKKSYILMLSYFEK